MLDQSYSTSEIAHFLSVSVRTAAKLIDSGEIVGWRIPPDYLHRRVPAKSLANYLAINPAYRELLRTGAVKPRRFSVEEIAELVAEADEVAELAADRQLATAG